MAVRQGRLELRSLDAETFLRRVRQHGASEAAPGGIESQYEQELLAGDPRVAILALHACDKLVGALSYATLSLRNEPGTVGGRIDVVLTDPHCRGLGIARLLMSALFVRFVDTHGERLRSFSVIAAHPVIGRFVAELGFERLETGGSDLYTLQLGAEQVADFGRRADERLTACMSALRRGCVECQRRVWTRPWCRPEEEE